MADLHSIIDKSMDDARKKGYDEGYEDGHTDGRSDSNETLNEKTNWFTQVGDGENFWESDKYSVWGITNKVYSIIKSAKPGDIIWFIKNKKHGGNIIAFAVYQEIIKRKTETKLSKLTNEEFKWKETGQEYNYLLKYKHRINIEIEENLFPNLTVNCPCYKSTAYATALKLIENNINLDEIYERYA